MQTIDCVRCESRGWEHGERSLPGFLTVDEVVAFAAATKRYGITGIVSGGRIGDPEKCTTCNGFGIISNRSHDKYKTLAMANRYRGTKAAKTCYMCYGKCMVRDCEVMSNCFNCNATGKVLRFEFPADFDSDMPEDFHRTDRWESDSFMSYMQNVNITVKWSAEGVTWNEYNLGIGCVYSSTDYGDMWNLKENALVAEAVKQKLLREPTSHQMCKFMVDGKFSSELWIVVKRNGHSVIVPDKPVDAILPPTYTQELLNMPVTL